MKEDFHNFGTALTGKGEQTMHDREKVIKGLEWILADDKFGFGVNWETGEPRDEYEKAGKIITDAIALLKELDAAYQGATELLRQKTILFDDAIKRLKEQQERIETLESLRRIEQEGR